MTAVDIVTTSGGAVWTIYRGPTTIVRTWSDRPAEPEIDQMVKVWYRVHTDESGEPDYAFWILVEGYKRPAAIP
jgi:hypothetical protein